ncbi:MAG: VOC family protein [Dehalogenimonas sp.]
MATLNAYLMFNGNAKEAMEFYKDCFGGKLDLMTYGDSPMGSQTPAHMKNRVMHSYLESGGIRLMAGDVPEGTITHGDSLFLCLVGGQKGEIQDLFKNLSLGGKVGKPLEEEFFGTYGELTDKFGFKWMFQYGTGQLK